MEKSPVTGTATMSVTFTECTTDPLVPRIDSEYVPAGVDASVNTLSADDPDPVTVAALNPAVAPAGRPVTERVTSPVNPEPAATAAVYPALPPGATDTDPGVAEMEKSETVIVRVAAVLVSPPLSVTRRLAV